MKPRQKLGSCLFMAFLTFSAKFVYSLLELLLNDCLVHTEGRSPSFSLPLCCCINSAGTWEQSESCRGKFKCTTCLLLAVSALHPHIWQRSSGISGICGIWFTDLNRKTWDMFISPFCGYCTPLQTLLVQILLRLFFLSVWDLQDVKITASVAAKFWNRRPDLRTAEGGSFRIRRVEKHGV